MASETRKFALWLPWVLGLAVLPALGQGPPITGSITQSAQWSGTVVIEGTAVVEPGVRIDVAAGTTVAMRNNAVLRVRGRLMAEGTEAAPIRFTRENTSARWKQITFVSAEPSRFAHCTFEYANSAGTHLDYYDNDCNPATPAPPRNYHEAVVILASHVDFEACTFQNLPDGGATAEGDALAIISDDPQTPGLATAIIRNCRFIAIGQGIHTRFAPIVVEGCFFTRHRGDNDDIDLYGESEMPPLIINNRFIDPTNDDAINPTRCSAVLVGNYVTGSTDHGIVLRDKCRPILISNVVANCAAGGISVQNQCDALLVNNTIVNCGRGVRLFDHTGRWNAPYCLFPGSGKATLVNCIIWNCQTSLTLTDSPYTGDRGSHVTVIACNIQGGRASASVSAQSTLTWGEGNISVDPKFSGAEFRLAADSPMIDAGVDPAAVIPGYAGPPTTDRDGVQRPLDGDGDGTARFDIGAYEVLRPASDSNGDGIPDGWLWTHGLNLLDARVAQADDDGDGQSTRQEYAADTDPRSASSFFRVEEVRRGENVSLEVVPGSPQRRYTLLGSEDLRLWQPVAGQADVPGGGQPLQFTAPGAAPQRYFKVEVRVP